MAQQLFERAPVYATHEDGHMPHLHLRRRSSLPDLERPPSTNGVASADAPALERVLTETPPTPSSEEDPIGRPRHRLRSLLIVVLAAITLSGGGVVGYHWWQDSLHYVSTDNAQIGGYMVQIGGLSAGRVVGMRYDVGDRVNEGDIIGTINVPTPQNIPGTSASRPDFTGTNDTRVNVTAPSGGIVVARNANPGDTVPEGQPLLTIIDPNQLWVAANVEETQMRRLQPGQPVSVHVDNLDLNLTGKVDAITQASAQSFSPLPQQNLSGNYTKVTQLQPVKISLDRPDPRLALGTSVEVRIRVDQ